MISVDLLYRKVEELLVKDQQGYSSGDEFNNDLQLAQNDMLLFFKPQDDQAVHNAIRPFLAEQEYTAAASVAIPGDYFYHLNGKVIYFTDSNGTVNRNEKPSELLVTDNDYLTLSSPIRGASLANNVFYHRILGSTIYLYPNNLVGRFMLSYIRRPVTAVWGFMVDLVNEIEVYDAGSTTDLEWPEEQLSNFVAVLAFYRGVQVRDNEIVRFLAERGIRNPEPLQKDKF